MANAIIDTFDLWTTAQALKSSNRGRSASNQSLLGIKKLRELILELAVRGKLVPQNSKDEPITELVKKIRHEKNRLETEGKIKRQLALPAVGEDEKPFDLPLGWGWQKLGNLGYTQTGGTPSKNDNSLFGNDVPFIKPGDIYPNYIDYNNEGLSFKGVESLGRLANEGSILMVCIGTIGKCNTINRPCTFNQQINSVSPYGISSKYLLLALNSKYFQDKAWEQSSSTTIAILNKGKWENIGIPVAPLTEQQRIVAKVDELMVLCDQLEQQQTNTNEAHQTLVDSLLGTLTNAENPAAFEEAWQRIANHFDTLLTTEHNIDQLKQTILQLAVMGKLVSQNPDDEPANELLKKIAKEKARLVKEGKIKKQATPSGIIRQEKPFELPDGWEFIRLEEISSLITKGSSPKWQGVSYTENPDDVLFVTSENVGSYELLLDEKKFVEMKFNEIEPRSILMKGDYLMNIVGGSIGRTAIYNIDILANINQAVCLIRILPGWVERNFLLHFFNSSICVSYMFDKQVDNARANLSMGNISKFVIPVPPPAEQHRIVSKIEDLFALCDALKERLRDAQALQNQLAVAVVEQAV